MAADEAKRIIEGAGYGMLATDVGGQPRVRPMAFAVTDGLRLLSSTYRRSGKAGELAANPRVEVCFVDTRAHQLRIEGRANIGGGPAQKRELLALNPGVRRHFKDEFDPEFVLIEIVPVRARWMPPGFGEYREIPL